MHNSIFFPEEIDLLKDNKLEAPTLVLESHELEEIHLSATVPTPETLLSGQVNIPDEDILSSPEEGSVIPSLSGVIVLIKDKVDNVIDLKDIKDQIEGIQSVSREHATLIEDKFGSFLTNRMIFESFTEMPTKANYQDTLKFLNLRIAKEEQEIILNTNGLTNSFTEQLSIMYGESYYDNIRSLQKDIKTVMVDYGVVINKIIENSSTFIFKINGEFKSLTSIPIVGLEINDFDVYGETKISYNNEDIVKVLKNLSNLLSCKYLSGYLYFLSTNKNLEDIINTDYDLVIKEFSNSLTIQSIFKIMSDYDYASSLYRLENVIKNDVEFMAGLKNEIDSDPQNEAKLISIAVEHTDRMNSIIEFYHFSSGLIARSKLMIENIKHMLRFLSTCI